MLVLQGLTYGKKLWKDPNKMESKLGNSITKHPLQSHIYAHTQSAIDKIWQILISEGQQTFVKRKKALLIVEQQQQQRVWNTSIYWNYFKWLGQRGYFVISLVTVGCWKAQCDYQWVYLHRKRPCIFPLTMWMRHCFPLHIFLHSFNECIWLLAGVQEYCSDECVIDRSFHVYKLNVWESKHWFAAWECAT